MSSWVGLQNKATNSSRQLRTPSQELTIIQEKPIGEASWSTPLSSHCMVLSVLSMCVCFPWLNFSFPVPLQEFLEHAVNIKSKLCWKWLNFGCFLDTTVLLLSCFAVLFSPCHRIGEARLPNKRDFGGYCEKNMLETEIKRKMRRLSEPSFQWAPTAHGNLAIHYKEMEKYLLHSLRSWVQAPEST